MGYLERNGVEISNEELWNIVAVMEGGVTPEQLKEEPTVENRRASAAGAETLATGEQDVAEIKFVDKSGQERVLYIEETDSSIEFKVRTGAGTGARQLKIIIATDKEGNQYVIP